MSDSENKLSFKSDAPLSIRILSHWSSGWLDVISKIGVPVLLGLLLYLQHGTTKAIESERLASEIRSKQYLVQNEENARKFNETIQKNSLKAKLVEIAWDSLLGDNGKATSALKMIETMDQDFAMQLAHSIQRKEDALSGLSKPNEAKVLQQAKNMMEKVENYRLVIHYKFNSKLGKELASNVKSYLESEKVFSEVVEQGEPMDYFVETDGYEVRYESGSSDKVAENLYLKLKGFNAKDSSFKINKKPLASGKPGELSLLIAPKPLLTPIANVGSSKAVEECDLSSLRGMKLSDENAGSLNVDVPVIGSGVPSQNDFRYYFKEDKVEAELLRNKLQETLGIKIKMNEKLDFKPKPLKRNYELYFADGFSGCSRKQ